MKAQIECYFDGCCEPVNPGGTAAFGAVIMRKGERIWEWSEIFRPRYGHERKTSNNVAEYLGFIAILKYLKMMNLNTNLIRISGDSRLVIYQMFDPPGGGKRWWIKRGLYVPHARRALELLKKFPNATGRWIPRDENELADELSKRELKKAGVTFRLQPED